MLTKFTLLAGFNGFVVFFNKVPRSNFLNSVNRVNVNILFLMALNTELSFPVEIEHEISLG